MLIDRAGVVPAVTIVYMAGTFLATLGVRQREFSNPRRGNDEDPRSGYQPDGSVHDGCPAEGNELRHGWASKFTIALTAFLARLTAMITQ